MFDLVFSILLSDPKAWGDPRSLVWYLSAVGAAYVVGFVPSQEKELVPKHVSPLDLLLLPFIFVVPRMLTCEHCNARPWLRRDDE